MSTQLRYDILSFIFNNKDEIVTDLKTLTQHLTSSKSLFNQYPDLYKNIYMDYLVSEFRHYIAVKFNCSFEDVSEVIDKDLVLQLFGNKHII